MRKNMFKILFGFSLCIVVAGFVSNQVPLASIGIVLSIMTAILAAME